jgi:hypothetical protein
MNMNLQDLWQQQPTDVSRVAYPARQATVADRVRRQMGPLERNYNRRQALLGMAIPLVFGGMYLLSLAHSEQLTWMNGLGMGLIMLMAFGRSLQMYLTIKRWPHPAALPATQYLEQSLRRIQLLRRDIRQQKIMLLMSVPLIGLVIWGIPDADEGMTWAQGLVLAVFMGVMIMIFTVLYQYYYRAELQRYEQIEVQIHSTLAEWRELAEDDPA